jgi:putative ABC transport system permease protein
MIESLLKDLRYGIRTLLKNPGFTTVAVLSLALGIGVNATIFSLVNAVLLRPVTFAEPERLVEIYTTDSDGYPYSSSSYPDYLDYRDQNTVFSGVIAHTNTLVSHNLEEGTELLFGEMVTGNYFDVLEVETELGRTFRPEENETPGAHPVVVLSHGFWERRFGADPGVVGQTVRLNGNPFTIIGVAEEEFTGTFPLFTPDFWAPIMMLAQINVFGGDESIFEQRGSRSLFIKARLEPGVSLEEAEAQVATISARLEQEYPDSNENRPGIAVPLTDIRFHPLIDAALTPVAGMLMGVVGLVLLIACANIANMLMARASARRREIAVRLALGGSRLRLIRQLLTESVLLGLAGGALGLLLAYWTTRLIAGFQPPMPIAIAIDLGIDMRVLAFTLAASLATALLFGLAPAMQSSRPDVIAALKDEAARSGLRGRRFGLRNLLVVSQVAVSMVLLVGAGLLLRSLVVAQSIDLGFEDEKVAIVSTNPELLQLSREQTEVYLREVLQRVEALPGAESAALTERIPLGQAIMTMEVHIEGQEPAAEGEGIGVDYSAVGPGYFRTLSIPLVAGREFTYSDDGESPQVVIVNETFARQHWPGESPLGKRISTEGANGPWIEVVGVSRDYKVRTVGEEPRPLVHLPLFQSEHMVFPAVMVRTSGDPAPMVGMIREEMLTLQPNTAFFETKTMAENVGVMLFPVRAGAVLLGIFGFMALGLAAVGLYGVIAYSVARRTHEIGIRMALGARATEVMGLVVRQGMALVLVGVALGLAGGLAVTHLASNFLYGVGALDPLSFIGAALILLLVALVANFIPARRGATVDPMEALRYE